MDRVLWSLALVVVTICAAVIGAVLAFCSEVNDGCGLLGDIWS